MLWNYYNNFDIKTNNSSEGFNNHHIFGNKRPRLYNALYEFRILIKESLDSYDNQVKIHGSQQILRESLINTLKNFIDKYELDYQLFRNQYDDNDINGEDIDIEDDNEFMDALNNYTELWYRFTKDVSNIIKNINISV